MSLKRTSSSSNSNSTKQFKKGDFFLLLDESGVNLYRSDGNNTNVELWGPCESENYGVEYEMVRDRIAILIDNPIMVPHSLIDIDSKKSLVIRIKTSLAEHFIISMKNKGDYLDKETIDTIRLCDPYAFAQSMGITQENLDRSSSSSSNMTQVHDFRPISASLSTNLSPHLSKTPSPSIKQHKVKKINYQLNNFVIFQDNKLFKIGQVIIFIFFFGVRNKQLFLDF